MVRPHYLCSAIPSGALDFSQCPGHLQCPDISGFLDTETWLGRAISGPYTGRRALLILLAGLVMSWIFWTSGKQLEREFIATAKWPDGGKDRFSGGLVGQP